MYYFMWRVHADQRPRLRSRPGDRAEQSGGARPDALGVSQKSLAATLGISESSVSRLVRGNRAVAPDTKEGELAVLFVRLFRSLDALVGGDESKARNWITADNHHLGGVPAERIRTVTGLMHVTQYLDAMRGKN